MTSCYVANIFIYLSLLVLLNERSLFRKVIAFFPLKLFKIQYIFIYLISFIPEFNKQRVDKCSLQWPLSWPCLFCRASACNLDSVARSSHSCILKHAALVKPRMAECNKLIIPHVEFPHDRFIMLFHLRTPRHYIRGRQRRLYIIKLQQHRTDMHNSGWRTTLAN